MGTYRPDGSLNARGVNFDLTTKGTMRADGSLNIYLTNAADFGGAGAVSSVFTRTGAVVAQAGDYSAFYQPLDSTLTSLAAFNTNGILTQTAADTFTGRTITGTASRLSVTNGDGVAGNPTLDIDSAYVGQATITTLGTVATGTWSATTIAVNKGGTGQTTYTNGQLLIGNTTGSTLTKATLTQPAAGLTITNGTGTITFALANDLSAVEGLASNGIAVRTTTDTWTTRTITGTASRLAVTNGGGVAGNPTLDIDSAYVGQATITTLGTIATGTWSATTIAVNNGGTGQTSYTDGQLLIGNTTGNTLAKATLTAGTSIAVTNGSGTITLAVDVNGTTQDTAPAGNDYVLTYDVSAAANKKALITDVMKLVYPVGCIYFSTNSTNPATSLGFGTWTAFGAGQVPVGFLTADTDFGTDEATGGEKTHVLTVTEMPSHTHATAPTNAVYNVTGAANGRTGAASGASTGSAGSDGAHNNLQPFIVVRMWKRTA